MKEKEFTYILNREKSKKDTNEAYSKQIALLIDVVNYGSNLIRRALDASDKKLEDIVVICVLLKQIVLMVDSVEVLLSKGASGAALLQARAAFEAYLYINWILTGESRKKAQYYYVYNKRKERLWLLRSKRGTPENNAFIQSFKKYPDYTNSIADGSNNEQQINESLKEIDLFLSKPEWSEINEAFDKRKAKLGYDPNWYSLLGVRSIRWLAKTLGLQAEYIFCYDEPSGIIHASSSRKHISILEKAVVLEPIRQIGPIEGILRSVLFIAIESYRLVLNYYIKEELSEFANKYDNDWRSDFLNIPSVTINQKVYYPDNKQ